MASSDVVLPRGWHINAQTKKNVKSHHLHVTVVSIVDWKNVLLLECLEKVGWQSEKSARLDMKKDYVLKEQSLTDFPVPPIFNIFFFLSLSNLS